MSFNANDIDAYDVGYILSKEEYNDLCDSNPTYIKINIPDTEAHYRSGNGEGCFAIVADKDLAKYHNDNCYDKFKAVLANYSAYFPLKYGTIIPCIFAGSNRPLVDFNWIKERCNLDE